MLADETKVDDIDETREAVPYRYTITAYGADYPVDGLVKRLNSGDIIIPTFDPQVKLDEPIEGYQRQFIWSKPQCDKFIESLLLGLPVPGIFLVKQSSGKFLVLDGQQRLKTLQAFYKGILREKAFALDEDTVQDYLSGLTYETLQEKDRRRLDDSIIHATIVRQDEPSEDQSSIYLVFERLNTGGTSLQPQEIRVALYRGGLSRMLRSINDNEAWRTIYGNKSNRLKDQELILRFFALLYNEDSYERPMKDFLNKYSEQNNEFQKQSEEELIAIFENSITTVQRSIGNRAFRLSASGAINAAVFDSVMVGIAQRILAKGDINDIMGLHSTYKNLLQDNNFLATVGKATADEESVKTRLRLTKSAFTGLD